MRSGERRDGERRKYVPFSSAFEADEAGHHDVQAAGDRRQAKMEGVTC